MKRVVFKDWVVVVLALINMLAFCVMGSDCESLSLFFLSHIIAAGIFALNSMLILKYAKRKWLEDTEEEE